MLKGSVTYNTISNNSVTHADDYYLDPYTVYVNPYYVATHHSTTVEASKHYYMNSQRIASALIDQFFVCEEDEICGLEVNNDPTHDHGFEGSSLRGVAQNLSDLLSHFNLSDGTDYEMDTLEKLEHFDQYYTQVDYNSATDGCDVLDAECHCAHSAYWAEQEEFDCSDYPLVYWYHPDYLGNTEYVTDMNGEAFQYFWYSPWGEAWVKEHSGNGSYSTPWRFNAEEFDSETGNYYHGARYRDPRAIPWLSVDPLANRFPHLTPYNFVENNPIRVIDPDGRMAVDALTPPDDYVFNENGNFVRIDRNNKPDRLVIENSTTGNVEGTYGFADPSADPQAIEAGTINKVVFVGMGRIGKMLGEAGAFDKTNRESEWSYMNTESKGGGKLDFSYSAIPTEFAAEGASADPLISPSPMLFIPEGDGNAHNHMNFGNFLWGSAGHSLGFSKSTLKGAAHYNSLFNSGTNGYPSQWDSSDDQFSIGRGVDFSIRNQFRDRTWSPSNGLSTPTPTR